MHEIRIHICAREHARVYEACTRACSHVIWLCAHMCMLCVCAHALERDFLIHALVCEFLPHFYSVSCIPYGDRGFCSKRSSILWWVCCRDRHCRDMHACMHTHTAERCVFETIVLTVLCMTSFQVLQAPERLHDRTHYWWRVFVSKICSGGCAYDISRRKACMYTNMPGRRCMSHFFQ